MTSRQKKILLELLAIYRKYDASEIRSVLESLRTGEVFRDFESLSSEFGSIFRQNLERLRPPRSELKKQSRPSSRATLAKMISDLLSSENPAHRELGEVLRSAQEQKILYPSAVLRSFLSNIGLAAPKQKDRTQTLTWLGQYLSNMRSEDVQSILRAAKDSANQESSLQRWTDIIVQKNRP
jgi:hypothetical protein